MSEQYGKGVQHDTVTTVFRCISVKTTLMQDCNKFVVKQNSVLHHDLEIDYNTHFYPLMSVPECHKAAKLSLSLSACCFNEGMWYLYLMSPERLPLWKWGDIMAPNSSSFSFFDLCRSPSRVDFINTYPFCITWQFAKSFPTPFSKANDFYNVHLPISPWHSNAKAVHFHRLRALVSFCW